jgi:hypothetical protein
LELIFFLFPLKDKTRMDKRGVGVALRGGRK